MKYFCNRLHFLKIIFKFMVSILIKEKILKKEV